MQKWVKKLQDRQSTLHHHQRTNSQLKTDRKQLKGLSIENVKSPLGGAFLCNF